jgi:hypothetical protein
MKTFVIVKREDLSIQDSYDAEVKDDSSANRSWLVAEPVCMHLEMPEGLDKDCLSASLVAESGTPGEEDHVPEHYAVAEDAGKVAAKVQSGRDSKLAKMRADRMPKMVEADVMVNDLVTGDRVDTAAVQLYRNQLKDITDTFKDTDPMVGTDALDSLEEDLSDLMWPTKP